MKTYIWCKLFGHKFLVVDRGDDGNWYVHPDDWCSKCGLTKKELFEK